MFYDYKLWIRKLHDAFGNLVDSPLFQQVANLINDCIEHGGLDFGTESVYKLHVHYLTLFLPTFREVGALWKLSEEAHLYDPVFYELVQMG